jgi:pseudouridylate synthase
MRDQRTQGLPLLRSPEVQRATEAAGPLVALETSVVAQGLPYPESVRAAQACEAAIREEGATPAAIAVLDGQVHIGLEAAQLERLAAGGPGVRKLGARDLPVALSQRLTGGTTVSATCELAARAGIPLFATGGIGGVHRGFQAHLDISQDLLALSRWPIGVVCAGAKSILDLGATLEALEALAVPVVGVGTLEFPAFYSRGVGHKLEHAVDDASQAAALLWARFMALGQGGVVLALPPPQGTSLPPDELERLLTAALAQAQRQGIHGKALTPYLLAELGRASGGRTLAANLALLVHNARFAAKVAAAYAALRS